MLNVSCPTSARNESRSSTSASVTATGCPSGPSTNDGFVVPAVGGARAPERAAARIRGRPAQRLVVGIAGVVVARVELDAMPRGIAQVDEEGVRDAVPPRAALDARGVARRGELVARAQHAGRVRRPRSRGGAAAGRAPAVRATSWTVGLRASQAPVIRSSGPSVEMYSVQRKPSDCQKRERRLDVGDVEVEVVDARDRRAALEVEALQLRVELAHLAEEREREAERVAHVQRAPHARMVAVDRCASRSRARRSRRPSRRGRRSPRTRKESRAARPRPGPRAGRASGATAPPSRAGRARRRCRAR